MEIRPFVVLACSALTAGCISQQDPVPTYSPVPVDPLEVGDDGGVPWPTVVFEAGAPDCGTFDAATTPVGCSPNIGVCDQYGATCCAGWDCPDGGPSVTGTTCGKSHDDTYVCGPGWAAGYFGDPMPNGCVRFRSNWCAAGGEAVAYACPDTTGRSGPNQGSCDIYTTLIGDQGAPNGLAWCCQ